MKVNFKELLGELYTDEIANVLDPVESKLVDITKGGYIPKDRFDTVNEAKKVAEAELEKVKLNSLTEEDRIAKISADKEQELATLKTELNYNKLGKLFADSGIKGYEDILKNVVNEDFEKSEILANSILGTLQANVSDRDKEIEKLKISITPKPVKEDTGGGGKVKENYSFTELAELKVTDPQKYDEVIRQRNQENK